MDVYRRILEKIRRVELVAGAILVLFVASSMCLQVFMRYVVNKPLVWVQESVMMAFIWITMLGAGAALKRSEHIKIDTFLSHLPQRTARIISLAVAILILVSLSLIAYLLPRAIQVQNRSVTSSLPINIPRGFYYSLPVLVGIVSMIVTQIYHVIGRTRELLGLSGAFHDYPSDGNEGV